MILCMGSRCVMSTAARRSEGRGRGEDDEGNGMTTRLFTGDNFVLLLCVLYVVAMGLYLKDRQWAKALYWFGAWCIVVAVRWMK